MLSSTTAGCGASQQVGGGEGDLHLNISTSGCIPVFCLIYLNTKIYTAMKTIKHNLNKNKKHLNIAMKGWFQSQLEIFGIICSAAKYLLTIVQ